MADGIFPETANAFESTLYYLRLMAIEFKRKHFSVPMNKLRLHQRNRFVRTLWDCIHISSNCHVVFLSHIPRCSKLKMEWRTTKILNNVKGKMQYLDLDQLIWAKNNSSKTIFTVFFWLFGANATSMWMLTRLSISWWIDFSWNIYYEYEYIDDESFRRKSRKKIDWICDGTIPATVAIEWQMIFHCRRRAQKAQHSSKLIENIPIKIQVSIDWNERPTAIFSVCVTHV